MPMLLAYPNRVNNALFSTNGAWQPTLPAANAGNPRLSAVARSVNAAASSTALGIDLRASYSLRAAALVNHNLSTAATIKVSYGSQLVDISFSGETVNSMVSAYSGGNGTRINSLGLMVTVLANSLRMDYDPVTFDCKGLLVEEQRTNLALQSGQLNVAPWSQTGATVTANTDVSPTGLVEIDTVVSANSFLTQVVGGITGATDYGVSLFVKAGTGTDPRIAVYNSALSVLVASVDFTWSAGVPSVAASSGWVVTPTFKNYGGGIYRLEGVLNTGAQTTMAVLLYPSLAGTVGTTLKAWGMQVEAGSFVTSHIPTTTGVLLRAADAPRIKSPDLGTFFNATAGTLYIEYTPRALTSSGVALSADNFSSNNSITITVPSGTPTGVITTGGVVQATMATTVATVGATTKVALAYGAGSFATAKDNASAVTSASGTVPGGITNIWLGWRPTSSLNYLNGHIKRFAYWGSRLSDANVQAITGGAGPYGVVTQLTSGFVPALNMTFQGDTPSDWGTQYQAQAFFAATTARFVYVEIADSANAVGYVQIGRLFVGAGFQPAVGQSLGMASGRTDLSSVMAADNGAEFGLARRRRRTDQFTLGMLTQTEADRIHEMQAEIGRIDEVLYVPDISDAAYSQRYGFLALMEQLDPLVAPQFNLRSVAFKVKEKL